MKTLFYHHNTMQVIKQCTKSPNKHHTSRCRRHLRVDSPITALAAYACSLFLLQQIPVHAMAPRVSLLKIRFKIVKIHFSIWFLIVPQANKSVVYAGYKRGYILVQQAEFRTRLLVFCINQSTVSGNGRPFQAKHLAEKLIRHPSRECA